MRSDPGKLRMVDARPEIERHILARHKEILVVDVEGGLVAAVGSLFLSNPHATQQKHDWQKCEQQQLLHGRFPLSVGGRAEAFPSCLKNVRCGETCREFLTTEDTEGTEVT